MRYQDVEEMLAATRGLLAQTADLRHGFGPPLLEADRGLHAAVDGLESAQALRAELEGEGVFDENSIWEMGPWGRPVSLYANAVLDLLSASRQYVECAERDPLVGAVARRVTAAPVLRVAEEPGRQLGDPIPIPGARGDEPARSDLPQLRVLGPMDGLQHGLPTQPPPADLPGWDEVGLAANPGRSLHP